MLPSPLLCFLDPASLQVRDRACVRVRAHAPLSALCLSFTTLACSLPYSERRAQESALLSTRVWMGTHLGLRACWNATGLCFSRTQYPERGEGCHGYLTPSNPMSSQADNGTPHKFVALSTANLTNRYGLYPTFDMMAEGYANLFASAGSRSNFFLSSIGRLLSAY
jgi:hypothetical protein